MLLALLVGAVALMGGCQSEAAHSQSVDTQNVGTPDLVDPDSATAARFEALMAYAKAHDLHERPLGEIMQAVGLQLRGTPYVSFPLDQTNEEHLVCRLDGFDCFTFVEAVFALARGTKAQDYSWSGYARRTREQRYRSGAPMSYCSRLHYFSDWIAENEQRGLLRNVTKELGGVPLDKSLNYMSTHREQYVRFAENDSLYRCIREMEQALADLQLYHIPQDRIHTVYDELKTGDIVAFSTNIDGLDVTHTGLIYKSPNGSTGLLHASPSGGVKISPNLQAYVQSIDHQIGIIVARPSLGMGEKESG